MKDTLNKIGIKWGIVGIAANAIAMIIQLPLKFYLPDFFNQYQIYINMIAVVIPLYAIGFPLLLLLTKNMPKQVPERNKLGFKNLILLLLSMAGVVAMGIAIGIIPQTLATKPFGHSTNNEALIDMMLNSNSIVRVLFAAVFAPVFEELIFRKTLLDRLAFKNKFIAIALSGIMFGMFHGNFQQAFMACMLGWICAFAYVKTGNIVYSILIHTALNLTTSVGTISFLRRTISEGMKLGVYNNTGELIVSTEELTAALATPEAAPFLAAEDLLVLWLVILGTICLAGIVTVIILLIKGFYKTGDAPSGLKAKLSALSIIFKAPGMYVFYALIVFLFVWTYVSPFFIV